MGLTRGRDEGEEAAAVRWCSRNENRQSLQSPSLSLTRLLLCTEYAHPTDDRLTFFQRGRKEEVVAEEGGSRPLFPVYVRTL